VRRERQKKSRPTAPAATGNDAADAQVDTAGTDTAGIDAASAVSVSNLSLHALFEQQARDLLDRADVDEEQKQSIMLAMSCPCCGAGGPSFSFKLKRSP